jgi:hypothetical protein
MEERMSWQARWGSILLLAIGLARMGAGLAGSRELGAFAAATAASPAPQRFASYRGPEVFSSQSTLSWVDPAGQQIAMNFTPRRFARLEGPASRRRMYHALIAHGPSKIARMKTQPMFSTLASYSFCGHRMLLTELGADPAQVTDPIVLQLWQMGAVDDGIQLHLVIRCE